MTTHNDRRRTLRGRARVAPFYLLAVLAAIFGQPATAAAQWTTSGNNIHNTNTGYVGVGTTSPITTFQIRPAANVNMGFTHSGGAEAVITTFNDANNATVPLMIRGTSIKFQDGTLTERLRIGAGVAVGSGYVGLTAPTNGAIFQGNVAFGTSTADKVFTVQGAIPTIGATMAVFRTTGPNHGSGLALEATGTGNNNLGFLVSGVRKAAISWDNSRNFLGLLNTAYADTDFTLRLNNDGSLTYHDGTNGAERLRVTAAGNVGIGVANPAYPLTVRSSNAGYAPLNLVGGTGNIEIWKDTTPTKGVAFGSAVPGVAAGDNIHLSTYSGTAWTSRMTVLNSNGNVGVGTDNPSQKLDVAGSVNASGLCLAGDCKTAWSQIGGGTTSQWSTNGTSINYTTGFVGVGTASPAQQLHVNGSSTWAGTRVTTAGTGATINDGMNFGYDEGYGGIIWNREATGLVFASSNAERMRLDASGNLGVGTTTPGKRLDVAGSIYAGNSISLGKGVTNYAGIGFNRDVDTGAILDPSHAAHQVHREVDGNKLMFTAYNGAGTLVGYTLVIDASGNVGVGTDSPGAKLDVAGNANVNGNITATGNISAKYQDVAEWVPTTQKLEPGTVVVLDRGRSNHVLASTTPYDTGVAGVVSAQPGVILGEGGAGKVMVATTGRVRVRVDATRGPIVIGDLIVTSDVAGAAMRSEPVEFGARRMHAPGTIIGKALEPLASGRGEILVLLSLQ